MALGKTFGCFVVCCFYLPFSKTFVSHQWAFLHYQSTHSHIDTISVQPIPVHPLVSHRTFIFFLFFLESETDPLGSWLRVIAEPAVCTHLISLDGKPFLSPNRRTGESAFRCFLQLLGLPTDGHRMIERVHWHHGWSHGIVCGPDGVICS